MGWPCPVPGGGGGCCSRATHSSSSAWAAASDAKTRSVRNSVRIARWKRSILPVVVGERGWVSRCWMPFSRQIRSKSTSTGGWLNRPVNTFPLSVRIACRTPWVRNALASPSHTFCELSRVISCADTQNREWSSTPDSTFARVPSATANPPTTSICHNSIGAPRSHRLPLPVSGPPRRRIDQIQPQQRPITPTSVPAPGAPRPGPARTPTDADPTAGARTATARSRPRPRPHLMRTPRWAMRSIPESFRTTSLIPGQPRMQHLSRHPEPRRDLRHRRALTDHCLHCPIALLSH